MAPADVSPDQKARAIAKAKAIAEIAEWLAFDWDDCPDKDEAAKAIDKAYEALQLHSEAVLRNEVLATLRQWANNGTLETLGEARSYGLIRSAIRGALEHKTYGIRPEGKATDEAIKEALEAWRTGGKNLWPANAVLLEECGFSRVSPDALRMAWERRAKRPQRTPNIR